MDVKAAKEYLKLSIDTILAGGTLKDIKGISSDELEAVYAIAYNLYKTGKLDDADTLFKFLTTYDHMNQKYWFGLGAVRQAMKKFDAACSAYSYASLLDIRDPRPKYHAATCHLATGDKVKAAKAVASIEAITDKNSEQGRTYLAKAAELRKLIGEEAFAEFERLYPAPKSNS